MEIFPETNCKVHFLVIKLFLRTHNNRNYFDRIVIQKDEQKIYLFEFEYLLIADECHAHDRA